MNIKQASPELFKDITAIDTKRKVFAPVLTINTRGQKNYLSINESMADLMKLKEMSTLTFYTGEDKALMVMNAESVMAIRPKQRQREDAPISYEITSTNLCLQILKAFDLPSSTLARFEIEYEGVWNGADVWNIYFKTDLGK